MDIKTLKRNIKQLVETTISTTTDKSESYTNVISYAKFDYSGELHIEIRKNILELINETKNKFTIIDANKIMKLSSKHSVRMLMLLEYISNFSDDTGKRKSYTLDELNLMFGTNYTRLVEFERRVLKPIQAELASSSKLSFNYRVEYDKETATVGRARAVSVSIDVVTNAMLQLKLF